MAAGMAQASDSDRHQSYSNGAVMLAYDDVFTNDRAASYHVAATVIAPHAHDHEVMATIRHIDPQPGDVVLDYPSGGGYVASFLPGMTVWEVDPGDWSVDQRKLADLPDQSADWIVSIAGLHHTAPDERQAVYRHCHRVLRPGGALAITEVAEGSTSARFLNEFVDRWNPYGHEGAFMTDEDPKRLQAVGFDVSVVSNQYDRVFSDRQQCLRFTQALFFLKDASLDIIDHGIRDVLGGNETAFPWPTVSYRAVRTA